MVGFRFSNPRVAAELISGLAAADVGGNKATTSRAGISLVIRSRRWSEWAAVWSMGRMRPSGPTFAVLLSITAGPQSPKHPPKREWEEILIERMQIAWRRAVKDDLPRTVGSHHKHPFVIFVEQTVKATCLKGTGARHMSVVDMFNKVSITRDDEGDLDSASE